jgi:hypothetical protein
MKIKEHLKSRLGVVIGITGVWLITNVTDDLIKYYRSATTYIEITNPLVDRQYGIHAIQQDINDRIALMKIFSDKLTEQEFRDHKNLINQILNSPLIHEKGIDQLESRMDIQMLRLKMEPSYFLRHPTIYLFLGMGLLFFGLYYAEKYKPKPKEKTPDSEPTNPWDSLPAPELKKNSAINHQD